MQYEGTTTMSNKSAEQDVADKVIALDNREVRLTLGAMRRRPLSAELAARLKGKPSTVGV